MSLSAYWIVIWAMQHSPIALVSAIRESSVVIVAMMSIWVLKEETTVKHFLSAIMVAVGIDIDSDSEKLQFTLNN